jgi:molybdate transport system substrate-binding protein
MAAAMLASATMLAASISASADEIRVTSSNALKPVLEQVAPEFEKATGHKLVFTWGQAEILKGTSFDLAVLTAAVIDKLIMQGRLIGATRTAVAVSAAGLAAARVRRNPTSALSSRSSALSSMPVQLRLPSRVERVSI